MVSNKSSINKGSQRFRDFRDSNNSILNLGANNTMGDQNTNSIKEGMENIEIRSAY